VLGPGQQFNEVTLFAKATRTHDGVAVGNTELLVLNASAYQRCAERHPEIVQALLVSNVQRVHQLVELLNDLRALPKSVVLARILYKNACNVRGGGRVNSVDLDVAQDDIAKFLGVSRAYLNKAFAQLSDLGLIAQAYRKVRVLDMRALDKWIRSNMTYYTVDESKFAQQ
jgi:CRP-like cAMP-binding protein